MRMFPHLTLLSPRRGHARQMAAMPSIVEFCFRLRAAFDLHGYVHSCLSSGSGIQIRNTAPYAGQMCDVPTSFLVDWELRCQEAGMLVFQGPVGLVDERAKAHVVGAGRCVTLSTANALSHWMETGRISSKGGLT